MMMKLQGANLLVSLDMLPAALNKPVRSFSKGMTQKIGLAACFLAGREFYLFDEPMSGLDPKARALKATTERTQSTRSDNLFLPILTKCASALRFCMMAIFVNMPPRMTKRAAVAGSIIYLIAAR